jgi:dolichol-phosphate mannosyltransferase
VDITIRGINRTFVKFAIVGASGVLVNECVLIALHGYGFHLLVCSIVAIELSILSNFVLNNAWTFGGEGSKTLLRKLGCFQVISIAGALINIIVLSSLTMVGIDYRIANIIGIGCGFLFNYMLNKSITWGN